MQQQKHVVAGIVALTLATTLIASAQSTTGVQPSSAQSDRAQTTGVHPISGRRFAPVMDFRGIDWLDRAKRDLEETPEKALDAIGVVKGSTVAEIGAGAGYYTARLAARVGPTGLVYANELQPEMLDELRKRLALKRITGVNIVLGAVDDPKLPPSACDLVLIVDAYHEFSEPQKMLRGIRNALKPDGRLVLIEFRKEEIQEDREQALDYLDGVIKVIRNSKTVDEARDAIMKQFGITEPQAQSLLELQLFRLTGLERQNVLGDLDHSMSVADAKAEVEAEGFRLSRVEEVLPHQHILIFTKR